MRTTRVLVAVFTAGVLAVPTASLTTATAVTTKASAAKSVSAPHQLGRKPARVFKHTKIVNITPTHLQMRTQVVNYQFQPTFLQRKVCKTCHWILYDSRSTRGDGRVFYPVGYPQRGSWFWRIGTPERTHYRTSYSPVWKTFAT